MSTIIGRLIKILPTVSGESASGNAWVRGGFVIEVGDDYPKKVAFSTFGEERTAAVNGLQVGRKVQVTYSPESREYNDKWYTDLRCTKIEVFAQAQPTEQPVAAYPYAAPAQTAQPATAPAPAYPQNPAPAAPAMMPQDDDLPFGE